MVSENPHNAPESNQLDDWLDQLEEAFERGQSLQPEDLCQDPKLLPQLKEQFDKLRRMQELLVPHDVQVEPGQQSDEPAPPLLEKSPLIGRYKLLQRIGEGGMGTVWMAQQSEPIKRRVALKLMHVGFRGKSVIARFEAERQALAMMDHPNIAQIYDAGETERGEPYFVMELVQGMSITEYCDARKLTVPDRLKLFQQVCDAIQHAHIKGIIHRDIKPSNVLVSEIEGKPVVKVIDFGIAKALQADLTDKTCYTEFGQVLGTFLYMSPEQTEMNALSVDTRSDVYSLGILLYKLLTGQTPLSEEVLNSQALGDVLKQIRDQDTPRGSELLRKSGLHSKHIAAACGIDSDTLINVLQGDLDAILMKATANERGRRYSSPLDLSRDVQRYLDDVPVEAQAPSFIYRCRKFVKRHRGPVIAASIMLAVLIAGIIGTSWGMVWALGEKKRADDLAGEKSELLTKERVARNLAESKSNEALAAHSALEASREETLKKLHLARVNQVVANVESGRNLKAIQVLEEISRESHGWETNYLRRLAEGTPLTLRGHGQHVRCVAFSPTGELIASGDGESKFEQGGVIRVWDVHTGRQVAALHGHTDAVNCLAFTPDGNSIISGSSDDTIKVWDLETGTVQRSIRETLSNVQSLAVSPDGKQIAVGDGRFSSGNVMLCDTENTAYTNLGPEYTSGEVTGIAYSPDGRFLLVGRDTLVSPGTIVLWDIETQEVSLIVIPEFHGADAVVFHPSGKTFAAAGDDQVTKWSISGEKLFTVAGEVGEITSLAFSPDGTKLVAGGGRNSGGRNLGAIQVWDAATGQRIRKLRGHLDLISGLAFSPDGQYLASSSFDKTVKLWDMKADEGSFAFPAHNKTVSAVAVAPNGEMFASGDNSRIPGQSTQIKLWNFAGQELGKLQGHESPITALVFGPDNQRLVSGSWDGTIKVWDVTSGKAIRSLKGHDGWVTCLAVSLNGRLIVSGSTDKTLKVWDGNTGEELQTLAGHSNHIECVDVSPDGTRIVSGSADKTLKIWNRDSGEELKSIDADGTFESVSFSPNGDRLVSVNIFTDETDRIRSEVRVWDMNSGEEHVSHKEPWFRAVSFSPDGRRFAAVGDSLKLWDAETGDELLDLTSRNVIESLAFSPDGNRLIGGQSDGTIRIWDAMQYESVAHLQGHRKNLTSLEISPDGSRLVSGSDDKTAIVWNTQNLRPEVIYEQHQDDVKCVTFSPNGKLVASAGYYDKTVQLWDAGTGETLLTFGGHKRRVATVTFSSDGKMAASGGWSDSVKVWDTESGEEVWALTGADKYVQRLQFVNGDRQLLALGKYSHGIVAWDLERGIPIKGTFRMEKRPTSPAADALLAIPSGSNIELIRFEHDARQVLWSENATRHSVWSIHWHQEQARIAEANKDWFAAQFHLKRLVQLLPDNDEVRSRLTEAEMKWNSLRNASAQEGIED
ncbi:MAG: protein kinase [Planctomycetaceae bacterium]